MGRAGLLLLIALFCSSGAQAELGPLLKTLCLENIHPAQEIPAGMNIGSSTEMLEQVRTLLRSRNVQWRNLSPPSAIELSPGGSDVLSGWMQEVFKLMD